MRQLRLPLALALALAALTAPAHPAGYAGRNPAHRFDSHGHRAGRPQPGTAPAAAPVEGEPVAAWKAAGPFGGDVQAVAFSPTNPNLAFAGVAPGGGFGGGLYRSTNGGASWQAVAALAGISVFDLELAPSGRVYAATQNQVWDSSDNGLNWTQRPTGVSFAQVLDVTVDRANPQNVWIGLADIGSVPAVLVMRSTNGGLTWSNATPPLGAPISCRAIAVHPTLSNTVIAVFGGDFGGGQVWVTTNGGSSWTNRSTGLPNNPLNAVDYDGSRLLVAGGQLFGSQSVGLYSSANLGLTWTPLHDGTWPLLVATDIAVDPTDAATLLVATDGRGVNRSTNGGASWEIGAGGSADLAARALRFRPASGTDLLLGASALGVFRSTNGGDSFGSSTAGITALDLFGVHSNPLDPREVAVVFQGTNNGGVFTSTNGGMTWALEDVPPTRYSAVRFAPDGTLYALSSGPSSVAPEGVYRRDGGGWTGLGPDQGGFFESDLATLRFSANDPDLILAAGSDFGVAGFEPTIWRSTDAGTGWTKEYEGAVDNDFVVDLELVEDGTDQVMLAAYDGFTAPQEGGMLRSADGGDTWSPALTGLPAFFRSPKLCASPTDPDTFALAGWTSFSGSALYRTVNGGQSWAASGWTGALFTQDLACDRHNGQALYLAVFGTTPLLRSLNQGAGFDPFSSGLVGAGTPRVLYVGGDPFPRLWLAASTGSWVTELGDPLFSDGFETGDTSGWALTTP